MHYCYKITLTSEMDIFSPDNTLWLILLIFRDRLILYIFFCAFFLQWTQLGRLKCPFLTTGGDISRKDRTECGREAMRDVVTCPMVAISRRKETPWSCYKAKAPCKCSAEKLLSSFPCVVSLRFLFYYKRGAALMTSGRGKCRGAKR